MNTGETIVFPETAFRRNRGLGAGGRYEFIVVAPDLAAGLTLFIEPPKWTDQNVGINYGMECSLDAGRSWQFVTSSNHFGGPARTNVKTGETINNIWHRCDLPRGIGRLLKVWLNPINARATITIGPVTAQWR